MLAEAAVREANILVIEDNKHDVFLIRQALEEAGVQAKLTVLDDGSAALNHICTLTDGTGQPDLVLLDLNLPSLSGLEILEAARARECLGKSPVVILTSSHSSRDRSRAQELGVADYLIKPVDLDEFLALGNTLAGMVRRADRA